MKYHKEIKLNLGNYQSLLLGISDADSFDEIDKELIKEIHAKEIEDKLDKHAKQSLNMV